MSDRINALVATDHIKVELTIRLGGAVMTVAQLSALGPDDVLTLDRDIGDGVEVCVGDKVIAHGTLVSEGPGERLSVRISGPAEAA